MPSSHLEVARRYAGPPTMGHGGYVAGLLARRRKGVVQVTLRRPTPLDAPIELVDTDDLLELRNGDEVIASAEVVPGPLDLDVPAPPTLDEARAAEAGSPSHYDGRGVHPTCFGCGTAADGGLRIHVGPLEGREPPQVAAVWLPGEALADPDGTVDPHWVLAALDCPGAFAFIAGGKRAGLLGRIVFEQHGPVAAADEHVVTGWQVGEDGRKLFAGTALFAADGTLLASAKATWFQMTPG